MYRRKKRPARKFIFPIFLLLLAAAGGSAYYYNQVYLPAQVTPEPEIQTARVRSGDITITASGLGTVVPASQVTLGFKTGGVIAEIDTAIGERVEADQVLARLDDSAIQNQILEAQHDLQYLTSPYAIAQAEQAVFDAQLALEEAEHDLQSLQAGSRTSDSVIDATRANLILAQGKVDKAQDKFDQVAHLAEDNIRRATALAELSAATEARDAILRELNWYLGAPDEDEQAILDKDIAYARAELAAAEAYLAALKDEPLPEDLYIGAALNQLWQAERDLLNAQLALENTTLMAPFSGTVTALDTMVGQAVGTSPVISLATLDTLWLEFYLEESDLGLLAINRSLTVIFDAYPEQEIQATVMKINPALTTLDGSPVVQAWAQFQPEIPVTLYAGMSAEVELMAAETRDALLVPVQALRELAPGSYAVFVVDGNGDLKMRPVEIGLRDFANVEILSGLEKGEVVSTGTVEIQQ